MDDQKRKNINGLEDENAFSDTLINAPDLADKEGGQPQAGDSGAKSAPGKSGVKQPPWIGKIMGHFKLLRLIGTGAMGVVIQAEDRNLKRIVALKVLRKQISTSQKGRDAVEQFLREARAAASIEHPNIVRVYEINQHAGWWYIAMEMVMGNSLQEIIKAAGVLPASRACPIIADAATGLQAAHELGMVHRDIKPGNIMVTRNGHGKVSDFGLVRVEDPNDPFDTYAHQSVGTPYYIAPEVINRKKITPAADIYSLGATLFYILTGHPPYAGAKMDDILKQHLHSEPPNLQKYLPDCSPNLAFLIKRMMAKEPDERPAASEVAAILLAESIAVLPESSGGIGPGGSTVITDWQGIAQKTRASMSGSASRITGAPKWIDLFAAKLSTRWGVFVIIAILVFLGVIVLWLLTTKGTPGQDRRAVGKLFKDAPESYGDVNTEIVPADSLIPIGVPAFSWKGKIDTSGYNFIASRTGRYFYPIEDKRAILIRADQCVLYKTEQQAIKDRKQPAP